MKHSSNTSGENAGEARRRSVLVTGGTKRLGAAISSALENRGWRVMRSSHRGDAGADIVADLSAADGADTLFASALAILGGTPPDAIVNNAALFDGGAAETERVNLASAVRLTELMAAAGGGRSVVNILDCRVLRPGFNPETAYESSKARLLEETVKAARRFSGRIRVNAVAPGPVMVPETVREKAGACPLGRPSPEAVADAVAYLLGAEFTTGCVVPVDGGQSAAIG